jgi:hypothetical protein
VLDSSPASIGATRSAARRARLAEVCVRHETRGRGATGVGNSDALLLARQVLLAFDSRGALNGEADGVVPFRVWLELGKVGQGELRGDGAGRLGDAARPVPVVRLLAQTDAAATRASCPMDGCELLREGDGVASCELRLPVPRSVAGTLDRCW